MTVVPESVSVFADEMTMVQSQVQHDWKWPFWTVLVLNVPSFVALLIMISALIRPNIYAWALAPLLFFCAPVGFGLATVVAVITRNYMTHRWSWSTWIVLASALLAGLIPVAILMWEGRQAR